MESETINENKPILRTNHSLPIQIPVVNVSLSNTEDEIYPDTLSTPKLNRFLSSEPIIYNDPYKLSDQINQPSVFNLDYRPERTISSDDSCFGMKKELIQVELNELSCDAISDVVSGVDIHKNSDVENDVERKNPLSYPDEVNISIEASSTKWPIGVLLENEVVGDNQISNKQEHKSSHTEMKDVRTLLQYHPIKLQDICGTKWPGGFICNGDTLCYCKTYDKINKDQEKNSHLNETQNELENVENLTANQLDERGERLLSPLNKLQEKQISKKQEHKLSQTELKDVRKELQYFPVSLQDICGTKRPGGFICNGDNLCNCKTYYDIITNKENYFHLDKIHNELIENVTENKLDEKDERLVSPYDLQRKQPQNSIVNTENDYDKISKEDENNQSIIDECDKNCSGAGEKTKPKKGMFSRFYKFLTLRLSEKSRERVPTTCEYKTRTL